MKKIYFVLATLLLLFAASMAKAADRLVGGDLSMVPAYEQAGDQWLDESGSVIPDLIQYVKSKGWNAVRVRVFVDPSKVSDPSVCQDLPYVVGLSKRVKQAGMALLVDLHYSDTWADPSTQRIPASWTDHSNEALAAQLGTYTKEVMQALVEADAAPDYVQIGNEITYGLLWNTSNGKFPTDASQYATAGYCTTWNSSYAAGEAQWKRTALLLDAGAKAVRQTVAEAKIVVHTDMPGDANHLLHFHNHIRTAGFTDYDVIGLSYYPFWSGKLDNLGTALSKLKTAFPEKRVQVVETAWYNSNYPYAEDGNGQYSLASLPSTWTADAKGMVNYLNDLTARLKLYDNVDGLYYWFPEECGNGYGKKVMNNWINRGMWPSSNQKQHSLLRTPDGHNPVSALAQYAQDEEPEQHEDASQYFQNLGFETGDLEGWNIEQEFATQKASDITSWASKDVVRGTYSLELWNPTMPGGAIMNQVARLPNGRYTIAARARGNKTGFYLYAGGAKTLITGETPELWAATTNVRDGVLEFGIGARESDEDNYGYFDDFSVTRIGDANDEPDIDNTTGDDPDQPRDDEYTDEQHIVYRLYPAEMTASVKNGRECLDSVFIPSTIVVDEQTYYVTSIEGSAFNQAKDMTYVQIGKSVGAIWGSAFSDCWSLKTVEFAPGSELKTIDGWAFYNCAVDSIDLPVGVTEIPEGAFAHCWALDYVALRGEVTKIGQFAFSSWSADEEPLAEASGSPLSRGVWFYGVEEVPAIDAKAFCPEDVANATLHVHYAFVEDESFKALGFKEIVALDSDDGSKAYTDAQGLKFKLWPEEGTAGVVGYDKAHAPELVTDWHVDVPETLTVDDVDYDVTYIGENAFSGHWNLTAITLPESLERIGAWAFYNTGLASVVVYDGVKEIAEGTFSKCWALTNVELMGDLERIGDYAFSAWAQEGCASQGGPLQRVVLWSATEPAISSKAFFADDVREGTLYVDQSLVTADAYTVLGFREVLPIDPTAIASPVTSTADAPCYDMAGRRVLHPQRGLYIRQGRKVVVK